MVTSRGITDFTFYLEDILSTDIFLYILAYLNPLLFFVIKCDSHSLRYLTV